MRMYVCLQYFHHKIYKFINLKNIFPNIAHREDKIYFKTKNLFL